MPMDVVRAAMEHAKTHDDVISIGGGEPLLHPHVWEIIGLALGSSEHVWLATNGLDAEKTIALANMAKRGILSVALSQDKWHPKVDERVLAAFQKIRAKNHHYPYEGNGPGDLRELRTVEHPVANGRASNWATKHECCCNNLFIKPDGSIRWCGCPDAPELGTVFNPNLDKYNEGEHDCWKIGPYPYVAEEAIA